MINLFKKAVFDVTEIFSLTNLGFNVNMNVAEKILLKPNVEKNFNDIVKVSVLRNKLDFVVEIYRVDCEYTDPSFGHGGGDYENVVKKSSLVHFKTFNQVSEYLKLINVA